MYRVAIIGCGDMGTKHAAAWEERDDARITVVCDPQSDRMETLAKRYGAKPVQSWQAAVRQADVDIVSICTPACDHHAVALAAANAQCHILCEKAMALTLIDADEMIAVAKAKDVCFAVCHQYRSLARFQSMKHLIDEGRVGNPLYMRFTEMREVRPKLAMHRLALNGGPIHDMSGHLFDLARFLTGSEAESVSAVGTVFGKDKKRLDSINDFGIDTAEIQVRFEGGHCLSIGINWGLPEDTPGYSQDLVHGSLGVMYSDDKSNPDRFLGDLSDSVCIVVKDATGAERIDCTKDHDGPQACIDDLLNSINTGEPCQFSGSEGRAALCLILASLEAIETGQSVHLT